MKDFLSCGQLLWRFMSTLPTIFRFGYIEGYFIGAFFLAGREDKEEVQKAPFIIFSLFLYYLR